MIPLFHGATNILPPVLVLAGYYILNAAAGAMLPPEPGRERTRYGFFFRFVQLLAANGHRLESRLPGLAAELAAAEELAGRHGAVIRHTEDTVVAPGRDDPQPHRL